MASTGNIRVNGGFENAVNMSSGSLMFLTITGVEISGHLAGSGGYDIVGGAGSNDFVVAEGKALPESAAERMYQVIARRATPIALNIVGDKMHVMVENNVQGWYVNDASDNASAEQPGILPGARSEVLPSLEKALKALGTISCNDGDSGSRQDVDFSAAAVKFSKSFELDDTNFTDDPDA